MPAAYQLVPGINCPSFCGFFAELQFPLPRLICKIAFPMLQNTLVKEIASVTNFVTKTSSSRKLEGNCREVTNRSAREMNYLCWEELSFSTSNNAGEPYNFILMLRCREGGRGNIIQSGQP